MKGVFIASTALVIIAVSPVFGQSGTPEDQRACSTDVNRHCRNVISEGDFSILACLQRNRAKISKGCQKVLLDHGQ
jgi:Cysteine rich repeat